MRKSSLIIPISVVAHLFIINATLFFLTEDTYLSLPAIVFYNLSWLLIAFALNFYPTKRTERFFTNFDKLIYLYIIYTLSYFSNLAFRDIGFSPLYQLRIILVLLGSITVYRWIFYYLRNIYRNLFYKPLLLST